MDAQSTDEWLQREYKIDQGEFARRTGGVGEQR